MVVGSRWCVGLLSDGWWLRDRWENTFFFFYRKVKRSKLERGDIDPFS